MNDTSVDAYLRDVCGRCERCRTPGCKVHRWTEALAALREIVLASGLREEMKWGSPCYTLNGKNVVMLASFNDSCVLQFFRGAALTDGGADLERPGPSSQHVRVLRFHGADEVAHAPRRRRAARSLG